MFTKQSCQRCGTNIEFDADQIGDDGYTVSCPKCRSPVTLLRPPPIAAPPPIITKKRHRMWILGICVAVLAMLIVLLVSALNRGTCIANGPTITGAFGLVLGEKYTNSNYGSWQPEVAEDAIGGFYLTASRHTRNQDLPFIFINAHADENGRIYRIVGDSRGGLSSSAVEDLCRVTAETLARKYPVYSYNPKSQLVWIFGDAKRCIELRYIPSSPLLLVIEYREKELEQAFHARVKEARESAIRNKVQRQKL